MLAESRMMVPDCRKRLEASLADLKATLVSIIQIELKRPYFFLKVKSIMFLCYCRQRLRNQTRKARK